jgi:rRNA maturation endonuclease Nob1
MYDRDDAAALEAGFLHGLHGHDLSLVDATLIVAARLNRAALVTHDGSMREVAESLGVRVSWLPLSE